MLEADVLRIFLLAENRQRQRIGLALNVKNLSAQLYLARVELGVDGFVVAGQNFACDRDNALGGAALGALVKVFIGINNDLADACLLYTSPSPRDATLSRMPSSA